MPWVSWIDIEDESSTNEEVRNLFKRTRNKITNKVTRSPNACSPEDIVLLRNQGLSDKDILSLAQIISYYNMSTRLFESLSTIE